MGILVDESTRVLVQGITGSEGSFHTRQSLEYGTKIVAGVTPGKGGKVFEGIPVFNTVEEAVSETGANASVIYVPPKFAPDAVMEAADAGIKVIVCITEWIPVLDMVKVFAYVKSRGATLIGPNCPGVITPKAKCRMGVMPYRVHREGTIGIISRSGTLTYEAVGQLGAVNLGESTVIGIGGDPIIGTKFIDLMRLFRDDDQTEAILLIGEIGGTAEEEAADYIVEEAYPKPVIGFVAGLTAPPGRRMGHAGAIISGGQGGAKEKIAAMKNAGIHVVETPADIGESVLNTLRENKLI